MDIPVTFTYKGKQYHGEFSRVAGSGSNAMFHLTVDRYFWGRLRLSEFDNKWYFDAPPKMEELEQLANEFGDLIVAWYE